MATPCIGDASRQDEHENLKEFGYKCRVQEMVSAEGIEPSTY